MKKSLKNDLDIERLTAFAKNAMQDPQTRKAIGNAYAGSKDVFDKYFRDDRREGISKLARDQKAQDDLGDMVRSITKALDAGLSANKRRGRKVLMVLAGLIGLGVFVARRRQVDQIPAPPTPTQTPMTQSGVGPDGINGTQGTATHAEAGRS